MTGPIAELTLADWRRRIAELYAEVRRLSATDPVAALDHWRRVREELFRTHPDSPVLPADKATFSARHFPRDPALRFEVKVVPGAGEGDAPSEGEATANATAVGQPTSPGRSDASAATSATSATSAPAGSSTPAPAGALASITPISFAAPSLDLPTSGGGVMAFRRIGWVDVPFPAGERRLALYWMEGYAGGLFLPFRDATNRTETYGAGRYLLDAAKSADLGGDSERNTLVLDFNFAYQPSCAFDPKWSCPLAPRENWLDVPVRAGERLA